MNRRIAILALPALALACLLALPDSSFAQFRRGGFGRGGYGGYGNGYGGYGNGYGGYGNGYGGYGNGYGGYGMNNYNGYGWGNNNLGSPYASGIYGQSYATPIYNSGYSTVIPGSGIYQAAYPPQQGAFQGQGAIQDSSRCYIRVHVPANAQVLFDNTPTQQTGPDRTFMSPPLDNNQNYTYQITARWMENGQQRNQTRTVRLMHGQSVNVDFTQPQQGGGQGNDLPQFQQPNQPGGTIQPRPQPNPQPGQPGQPGQPRNNPIP